VCVDANAGARAAAKQRKLEKDANFQQKRLQFFNKETTFARTLDRNIIGYSRSQADARSRAIKYKVKVELQDRTLLPSILELKK